MIILKRCNLTKQQALNLFIQYLNVNDKNLTWHHIHKGIARKAIENNIAESNEPINTTSELNFHPLDKLTVRQVINNLINNEYLIYGDEENDDWPYLSLTEKSINQYALDNNKLIQINSLYRILEGLSSNVMIMQITGARDRDELDIKISEYDEKTLTQKADEIYKQLFLKYNQYMEWLIINQHKYPLDSEIIQLDEYKKNNKIFFKEWVVNVKRCKGSVLSKIEQLFKLVHYTYVHVRELENTNEN